MDLMFDMLLLAFQTDTTRISTLMLAGDGSNRVFPEIGVKDGHHHLSHHQNDADVVGEDPPHRPLSRRTLPRGLSSLAETEEGEGSVLDNSLIVFGGGISDGNRHNHENLPILLAGRGGGRPSKPAASFARPRKRRSATSTSRCSTRLDAPRTRSRTARSTCM